MADPLDFSSDMTFSQADAALLAAGVKEGYQIRSDVWNFQNWQSNHVRDVTHSVYLCSGVGQIINKPTLRAAVAAAIASLAPSPDDADLCAFAGVVSLRSA